METPDWTVVDFSVGDRDEFPVYEGPFKVEVVSPRLLNDFFSCSRLRSRGTHGPPIVSGRSTPVPSVTRSVAPVL